MPRRHRSLTKGAEMKTNNNYSKTFIVVLAVVAVLGIGSHAFAGWGWGHHGYGMGRGMGYDMGYGDDDYAVRGDRGNLSREQIDQLEKERDAFYKSTEKLRDDLYQKELALRSELAKENPDAGNAAELQKEISGLRSELDQKQLDYSIKTRKIVPNAGRGPGMGYGPGNGPCWR